MNHALNHLWPIGEFFVKLIERILKNRRAHKETQQRNLVTDAAFLYKDVKRIATLRNQFKRDMRKRFLFPRLQFLLRVRTKSIYEFIRLHGSDYNTTHPELHKMLVATTEHIESIRMGILKFKSTAQLSKTVTHMGKNTGAKLTVLLHDFAYGQVNHPKSS